MNHITTAASVKALDSLKLECKPQLIRAIWKAENQEEIESLFPGARAVISKFHCVPDLWTIKRACINSAAGFHGVEFLGYSKNSRPWPLEVYYCNAGDPYAGTILFRGPRLVVGCWGDLIEHNAIKE